MGYDLESFGDTWLGEAVDERDGRHHAGLRGHVSWFIPKNRKPVSLCFVHGGGGQSTDWSTTPDGRPGWLQYFLGQGYAVYLLDRPGFGRSGVPEAERADFTPAPAYEDVVAMLLYPERLGMPGADRHNQAPEGAEHAFMASMRGMRTTLAASQRDAEALAEPLLALTGDTVLVTHSAGAPCGWGIAAFGGGRVKAVVAVEPLGAPGFPTPMGTFGDAPTIAPLAGPDNPYALPILIVTAEASGFAGPNAALAEVIAAHGEAPDRLLLPEAGIHGNGHMMMMEKNSDQIADRIDQWIDRTVSAPA